MNEYNKKAITDVYKNVNIAITSLKAIIPTVKDRALKKELKDEFNGYDKEIEEINDFMEKSKLPVKKINPIKQSMHLKMESVLFADILLLNTPKDQ